MFRFLQIFIRDVRHRLTNYQTLLCKRMQAPNIDSKKKLAVKEIIDDKTILGSLSIRAVHYIVTLHHYCSKYI